MICIQYEYMTLSGVSNVSTNSEKTGFSIDCNNKQCVFLCTDSYSKHVRIVVVQ